MPDLVDHVRGFVDALARRYCDRPGEAEDVAQEVWLALLRSIHHIEQPACLHGWLKRVTINAALRRSHQASRVVPFDVLPEWTTSEAAEDSALENLRRAEAKQRVRAAMGRLRAADRELVCLLSGTDAPDYKRVSQLMARPVGSIGPTRQRALARLRRDPAIAALAS
jgi:RNA polymerase sigma factor (sigma-70 family)